MESDIDERIFFNKASSRTSYGSTSQLPKRKNQLFVQHNVTESDTLQGISVMYGVTVQQIKQANKLWTNDNLFMCKTLQIPVSASAELSKQLSCDTVADDWISSEISNVCNKSTSQTNRRKFAEQRCWLSESDASADHVAVTFDETHADVNHVDIAQYFSKYDDFLVKAKRDVSDMEEKQRQLDDLH